MSNRVAAAVPIADSRPAAGLTVGEFRQLLRQEAQAILNAERAEAVADAARLSLSRAATLAKTRPSTVSAALTSGALPGVRTGRDWSTTVAAVRAWIIAGRPVAVVKP